MIWIILNISKLAIAKSLVSKSRKSNGYNNVGSI